MESKTSNHGLPPIAYELSSQHALGGGSYVFKEDYPAYLRSLFSANISRIEINVIIQPNSSPHVGTLCTLGLAFVVAHRLQDLGSDTIVVCDLWDQAKGEETVVHGIKYQRSLRSIGQFDKMLPDYVQVLEGLSARYAVAFKLRCEDEFLRQTEIPNVIRHILARRSELATFLAPTTRSLAIRAPCPTCGLVDKYGVNNTYAEDYESVSFVCPHHGDFTYNVQSQSNVFQFNCQLFNLLMGWFYERVEYGYIEICGSDYAGFWQEQLLWRFLTKPIVIVYTPLIMDWSGSKISKSLYLGKTAYDYLRAAKMEYLLNFAVLQNEKKDLGLLW